MEQGACSPEEARFITNWLALSDNQDTAATLLTERIAMPVAADSLAAAYKEQLEEIRRRIIAGESRSQVAPVHRVHFLRRRGWAAAAILVLLCTAVWMVYRQPAKTAAMADIHYKGDAAPGREGAMLTLANGKTILLDSVANGAITNEQGTAIEKTTNGSLRYAAARANAAVYMNTLSTPRARKFSIILPDGTGVWLNAASSITFPSAFTGKERNVEVTGEVYFDVITDKVRPFIVKAGEQHIQVLGTSFNVNTYTNTSAVITTLIEGSVQLTDGKKTQLLHPGEQATGFSVAAANIPQTIAWKNGLLYFEGTDLRTIMAELSRWYDVDIVFDADAPTYDFTAKLPDNLPVSEVLKILEMTKLVHFDINGKTIIVKK